MPRLWYPEFLVDEWLPTGRESPEAWFVPLDPSEDADAADEGYFLGRLSTYSPGERIGFKWVERYGDISIRINPDGTLHGSQRCPLTLDLFGFVGIDLPADDRPAPNNIYDDESELWAESIESFARQYAAGFDIFQGDEPVTVEVEAAHWSDTHYFILGPDSKSLIPAPSAETTDHVHG